MQSGDANDVAPALGSGAAAPSNRGRKRAPLSLVLLAVALVTVVLGLAARFFQDIPPPPPVTAIIVRVPLEIDSTPSGARITADGHGFGETPLKSSLPVGVHTLDLERDGFAHLRRRIELVPGSPLAVQLPLTPLPGTLRVITDVETAEVALDGQPLTGVGHEFDAESVKPGKHKLTIASEKAHGSVTFAMNPAAPPVAERPTAMNMTVAAIARFADSGSVISNDPARIGLTRGPIVEAGPEAKPLPVEPGQNAELLRTGLAKRTVSLTHATVPSLSVLAALQTGSLVVVAGADNVSVWINDKMSRRQPHNGRLYFWSLIPGQYVVRVVKAGVADRSMKVLVEKDKQTSAEFLLNGSTGKQLVATARPLKPSAMPVVTSREGGPGTGTVGAASAARHAASGEKAGVPAIQQQHSATRVQSADNSAEVRGTPETLKTEARSRSGERKAAPAETPEAGAPARTRPRNEAASTAAPPPQRPTLQGLARFTVKTPGARITIKRVDVPDPLMRVIVVDSLRLPAGRWMVNATAPGFESYTSYFLVSPAGPADVFINLKPVTGGKKKRGKE
jgi:hypothetical protein